MNKFFPASVAYTTHATETIAKQSGTSFLRLDKDADEPDFSKTEPFQLGRLRQVRFGRDIAMFSTEGIR